MWVLYVFENGRLKINKKVEKRKPVEEYMKLQGRFKHLRDPEIKKIQQNSDSEYNRLLEIEKSGIRI
jgi:pyruvate/2-oxoacid:ferredoxin oxidoreductase beta subunit